MMGGARVWATVLLAAFVVVAADHHVEHHGADEDHTEEFDQLDDRIDHLTARLVNLEDRIHKRIDPARVTRARSLEHRVSKVEGRHCGEHYFQCGGTDPECISDLFVCDGHKDCHNGHDEDHCELPFKEGDVFEGHMLYDTCTKRKPETMSFEIQHIDTPSYFTAYSRIHGSMHMDYEHGGVKGNVALPFTAMFEQGSHKLYIEPPEADQLALACFFDGWNNNQCEGRIKHALTREICARLIFVRKH